MKALIILFIFIFIILSLFPSCGYEEEGGKDNDFVYGGGLSEDEVIASRGDLGVVPEVSDLGADLDSRLVDYNLYHNVYEEEIVAGEQMSPQAKFLQPRMF